MCENTTLLPFSLNFIHLTLLKSVKSLADKRKVKQKGPRICGTDSFLEEEVGCYAHGYEMTG